VKYVYIMVMGACLGYIASQFHWPYGVTIAAVLLVNSAAYLAACLVDEDRR
jgi:hypothetical protein